LKVVSAAAYLSRAIYGGTVLLGGKKKQQINFKEDIS
jgi:hypothetical protein